MTGCSSSTLPKPTLRLLIALCALLSACSPYDPALLSNAAPSPDASSAGSSSSTAGNGGDADAASMAGTGAGSGASGAGGAVADAGSTEPQPCRPNPNVEDQVCPEICPETCNNRDDDCDRRVDEEEASDSCAAPNAETLCQDGTGKCVIDRCLGTYRDCDAKAANGCEVAEDDPKHCGKCGHACTVQDGVAGCRNDECVQLGCADKRADCDEDPLTCETPTDTLANCGDCGESCMTVANGSPTCSSGSCGIEDCNAGYDDCDAKLATGCEQALDTLQHCGACNKACTFPGSQAECASSAGVCQSTGCSLGYDECDDNKLDGCESLATGTNCGECGKACLVEALQHVKTAACGTGTCAITCDEGWGNCDDDPQTGCETQLNSLTHCGMCATACDIANALETCDTGTCEKVECDEGYGDCKGGIADGCETSLDSLSDCGGCGTLCNKLSCGGGICTAVACAPDSGLGDCDGDGLTCEKNLRSDIDNCGTCGHKCEFNTGVTTHASLGCTVSGCKASCALGFGDCDGDYRNGCEQPLNTLTNCGACAVGCAIANATATCASGSCEVGSCNVDFDDCDGNKTSCESALNTPTRCGSCGNTCSYPNAVEGCGGTPGARACTVSACEQPYFKNCDGGAANGCEIDTRNDKANCNACSNDCEALPNVATAACTMSACNVSSCDPGYGDCTAVAGCETALSTVQNCGACGNNCDSALANTASTSCEVGTLTCKVGTCKPGFANCDGIAANGCETNIYSVQNCGGCANLAQNQVCENLAHANTTCAAGSCTLATCQTDWADCDGNLANGCERDVRPPASGGLGPCVPDTGCVKSSNGGHDYFVCSTARSWADARVKCTQQRYGDLARIDSSGEASFLGGKLSAVSWIGNNDSAHEGLWEWADNGVPFWQGTASGVALDSLYVNWAAGEPNASGNCGQLYTSGQYDDTTCTVTNSFVCEVGTDGCPSDASKSDPGQCGCGSADTDGDADGFAVCKDGCDADPNKRAAGVCGCGVADTNTDGDAQPDCSETCDSDPLKLAPGICGCGIADADTDSDGVADCLEACDADPLKQDPGACGCGNLDTNTDGDSQADCNDSCPFDASNAAACFTYLPTNVSVTQWSFASSPTWSCNAAGTTTVDSTAGTITSTSCTLGTLDITNNVTQYQPGLSYGKLAGWDKVTANPANLALDPLGPSITELNTEVASGTGERWVDSTTYIYTGEIYITATGVASFMEHVDDFVYLKIDSTVVLDNDAWFTRSAGKFVGTQGWHSFELRLYDANGGQGPSEAEPKGLPALGYSPTDTGLSTEFTSYTWPRNIDASTASLFRVASSGPSVMVVRLKGLTLGSTHTLKLTGNKPVVFLVSGNVSLASGTKIDANATLATPGAGGNQLCTANGAGGAAPGSSTHTGGGGGGGFGTKGGVGGTGDNGGQAAGAAGIARGNATLTPLMAGCPGGGTNLCAAGGGAGGGALQISASGTISGAGAITALGGNGTSTDCGAGGGSGGGVFLQAATLSYTGTVTLNGGSSSDGSEYGATSVSGSTSAANAGASGKPGRYYAGGSGGGGGYGRKRLN